MLDFFAAFRSGQPWLEARTILLVRHGSHAYGTSTPTSDQDAKGVAVPPAPYFHGFVSRFEQAESKTPAPDCVIYDVRKFFALAADCNPSLVELLWTDEDAHLQVADAGRLLLEHRGDFLSKKARHTFSGYAIAQLKRIQTHHRWLVSPPAAPPTRAEHGLPERTVIPKDQLAAAEAAVRKRVDGWEPDLTGLDASARIDVMGKLTTMLTELAAVVHLSSDELKWRAGAELLGYDQNFIDLLDRERRYRTRAQEWDQYQNWLATRNAARARLEAEHGYDTKHAMHLVRLLRMCREILATGRVLVKRPDAAELLAIRGGAWSYEQLLTWAEEQDAAMNDAAAASALPREPDRVALDGLCRRIVESML